MAKFYDFLFYLIYKFYSDNEKGAFSSTAGIIGGLQAINVLSVIMLFVVFINKTLHLSKILFLFIAIIFQITTYIRYVYKQNNSIQLIEQAWFEESDISKKRFRLVSYIYITLSVIVFFGLAIFLGSNKQ